MPESVTDRDDLSDPAASPNTHLFTSTLMHHLAVDRVSDSFLMPLQTSHPDSLLFFMKPGHDINSTKGVMAHW